MDKQIFYIIDKLLYNDNDNYYDTFRISYYAYYYNNNNNYICVLCNICFYLAEKNRKRKRKIINFFYWKCARIPEHQ